MDSYYTITKKEFDKRLNIPGLKVVWKTIIPLTDEQGNSNGNFWMVDSDLYDKIVKNSNNMKVKN